jgi:hypothetical protein
MPADEALVEVPLTRGYVAVIDAADADLVLAYRWHALVTRTAVYAVGRPYPRLPYGQRNGKKAPKVLLHRFILGMSDDSVEVDHRDQDGLNNRRKNLRLGSRRQNMCNKVKNFGRTSAYKGVCWNKKDGKWQAKIQQNRVTRYIGNFDSETEAALMYDRAAYSYHGEFAVLNFPQNLQYRLGWKHREDQSK